MREISFYLKIGAKIDSATSFVTCEGYLNGRVWLCMLRFNRTYDY